MNYSVLVSIGAFMLWMFSGFKQQYKYFYDSKFLLSAIIGVITVLIVFYIPSGTRLSVTLVLACSEYLHKLKDNS